MTFLLQTRNRCYGSESDPSGFPSGISLQITEIDRQSAVFTNAVTMKIFIHKSTNFIIIQSLRCCPLLCCLKPARVLKKRLNQWNVYRDLIDRMSFCFVLSQNCSNSEKWMLFSTNRTFLSVFSQRTWPESCTQLHIISKTIYCDLIWCNLLWSLKAFLDLKVLSQRLQGITIPSMWFASMWYFMALLIPSFPHTLQRWAFCFRPSL